MILVKNEMKAFLLGASSLVALALVTSLRLRRRAKRKIARKDRGSLDPLPSFLEEELFSRHLSFFGRAEFLKMRENTFVVVVGLGGVGSHAATMLSRGGVKRIRVVDFDQVTLSSLNRHATARWTDVGLPKAEILARALQEMIPCIQVEAITKMYCEETASEILSGNPQYVLDCIDDITTKAELLVECHKRGLKVVSSMGAALRSDPTRLHIGSLNNALRDPLAAKIKGRLKNYHGLTDADIEAFQSVHSSELPVSKMLSLSPEQKAAPQDYGVVQNFRIRILPVLGTLPALFGQTIATWVLCDAAGRKFQPRPSGGYGRKMCNRLLQRLRLNEWGPQAEGPFLLNVHDIELVCEQWRGRCPVTGLRCVGAEQFDLLRWDSQKPLAVDNLVLMETNAMKKFMKDGELSSDCRARIESILKDSSSYLS